MCAQVFTRSVTGVVLLSSNDEAECEMFAWKVCHIIPARDHCRNWIPMHGPLQAPVWHRGRDAIR